MPLIRHGGFVADDWRTFADDEEIAGQAAIVTLKRYEEQAGSLRGRVARLGVAVSNTAWPDALARLVREVHLIAIPFPAFNDGRAFSLARRLRRLGFKGTLRAQGHVLPDQAAYAHACGFDEIEISDALAQRQPEAHWRAAYAAMTLGYQPGYPGPQNILMARHAARLRQQRPAA